MIALFHDYDDDSGDHVDKEIPPSFSCIILQQRVS